MISLLPATLIAAALVGTPATTTSTAGGDHRVGESIQQNDRWPAGLADRINRRSFMHGFWVNADDFFFYTGDTDALNAMLAEFATLPKEAHLKIALIAENGKAQSPWDEAPRGDCNWRLDVINRSWRQIGLKMKETDPGYDIVFNVYLTGNIALDQLASPLRAEMSVGGAIGRFIDKHNDRRAEQAEEKKQLK